MFNVAANLLQTNWGQQAGENIRRNQLQAEKQQQQNMLAQALPAALQGDANALAMVAQADPGVYAQLENTRYTRDQAAEKKTTEDAEKREKQFFGKTAAGIASIFQAPAEQRPAAWSAWVAPIKAEYGDDADDLPDAYDEGTVRTLAFDLAAHDKAYSDLLSRTGALPQEPAKAAESPSSVREYQFAQNQGYKGTYQDFQLEQKRAGAPSVVTYGSPQAAVDANGNPVFIQGSNRGGAQIVEGVRPPPTAATTKDPTEDQNKSYGFYQNAKNSLEDLDAAIKEDPNAWVPSVTAETLEGLPVLGETAANASLTKAQQKYRQAIYTIADMSLRAETGANAPEAEVWRKVKQLTPRPGDAPTLREQKRKAINVIVDTLKVRAGRALPSGEIPGRDAGNAGVPDDIAAILKKHGAK